MKVLFYRMSYETMFFFLGIQEVLRRRQPPSLLRERQAITIFQLRECRHSAESERTMLH